MQIVKSPIKSALGAVLGVAALLGVGVFFLQRSDAPAIATAREVDAFILRYCEQNGRLPVEAALRAQFPGQNRAAGWFFYTDDRTYLKMQYPVKWWNGNAIGTRRISEFTATPYAYVVDYKCGREGGSATR